MKSSALKVIIFGILFLSTAVFAQEERFLTFNDWQDGRVKEAQAVLVKTQIDRADSIAKDNNKISASDVQQAKINVEIAKELTAHDYFVLYIIPRSKNDQNALLMAAQTLSKTEIVEILNAYQSSIEEKKRAINGPEKAPAGGFLTTQNSDFLSDLFGQSKKPKN